MKEKANLSVYIDKDLIDIINSRMSDKYSKSQIVADILRAGLLLQENLQEDIEATNLFKRHIQTLEETIKAIYNLHNKKGRDIRLLSLQVPLTEKSLQVPLTEKSLQVPLTEKSLQVPLTENVNTNVNNIEEDEIQAISCKTQEHIDKDGTVF